MTRTRTVSTGGVTLHCLEAGDGPLILLLHGFPDLAIGWRRQMELLVAAGFRVIAPDLRGYGASDRPDGVAAYAMPHLVADVAGVVGGSGEPDAVVAGHDWGGVIAWHTAMLRPEVVRRLVVLNAPHPAAFARELRRLRSTQLLRSWYAGFHQLPWLPELAWRAGDFSLLRRVVRSGPARSDDDVEAYVRAFAAPGAMTAALNYYRAALRRRVPPPRRIEAPTLLIWGERDPYLVPELTVGLDRWVTDLRVERLPAAGHWVQHDAPERVAALIAGFASQG